MSAVTSEPPREVTYPIEYQVFAGNVYNLDFQGRGLLTIRSNRPSYVFQGKPRGLFSGAAIEAEFGPEEIWNVVVAERCIRFHTHRGEAGKRKEPFLFFCRDGAEAATVAALLPSRQDTDFIETQDFFARLNTVTEARSPWSSVTNILVALNALVFVIMGCLGAGWFEVDSIMPYILYGANNGAATTDGQWWRLLTSMFMHFGLIHLLLNMWALFQAGHFLEKLQGRWLYALTYLGSGLSGGFVSIMWHGDKSWSAGASGAVFGVYGAVLGYLLREKQALPPGIYKPMLKSTLSFAGYNILLGLRAGVDNSAHVGGLLGGLVLGWLLALPVDRAVRLQQTKRKLQLGLIALAALIVAGVSLTPRFNYSIEDELAWKSANKDFITKETELLPRHEKAMAGMGKGTDVAAHTAWINRELIPFYDNWARTLAQLKLAPGHQTSKRRDLLQNVLRMKRDNLQHLHDGLLAQDANAVKRYYQEEVKVGQEIGKLRVP